MRGLTADQIAHLDTVRDAINEIVTVARLRGDNQLPHPCDDHKLWTARMSTAWAELEEVVDDDLLGAIISETASEQASS